jgi:hypothetical protein
MPRYLYEETPGPSYAPIGLRAVEFDYVIEGPSCDNANALPTAAMCRRAKRELAELSEKESPAWTPPVNRVSKTRIRTTMNGKKTQAG